MKCKAIKEYGIPFEEIAAVVTEKGDIWFPLGYKENNEWAVYSDRTPEDSGSIMELVDRSYCQISDYHTLEHLIYEENCCDCIKDVYNKQMYIQLFEDDPIPVKEPAKE